MTASVAMIPYTNMAPYRQLGAPRGCRFVPVIPRASIGALLSGEVVAAAVPVGGLKALDGVVETVDKGQIAHRKPFLTRQGKLRQHQFNVLGAGCVMRRDKQGFAQVVEGFIDGKAGPSVANSIRVPAGSRT